MLRSHKTALFAAAIVAIFAGVIFGYFWSFRSTEPPEIAGFVYPEPKAISPFHLVQHNGSTFTLDALKGKWTFVYFGFTYCPDVCPTTLVELNRVQKSLADAELDADNQYFLVTVDPQRDTPERLAQYVVYFNKKFIGATGSDEALTKFTQDIGILYAYPEGRKGKNYAVDHSSTLALFNPNARLHAVFTSPHRAEEIVEGFEKILRRWRQ
jgi:protein SCO1/2